MQGPIHPAVEFAALSVGHRRSIFSRMRLAFSIASVMATRNAQGVLPLSFSSLAVKIVAANWIAYPLLIH